jgi:peptide/nickel transport system ATP-binding protein
MTVTGVAEVNSPPPIVEAVDVGRRYVVSSGWFAKERIDAVKSVSLSLYSDQMVALVGESGSGKSTLGRMLIGLTKPTSGSISFEGVPLADRSGKQMREFHRRSSIIFQNPYQSLNPRMRVGSALAEALRVALFPRDGVADEVGRLLKSVQLSESYRDKYPMTLSGGERQRVAIARAVAGGSHFVIADEATSALDVSVSAEIVNLLLDLKDEQKFGCLFITHDIALAMTVAEKILIMRNGEIVDKGTPDELLEGEVHPYTRDLLETMRVIKE